MSQHRFQAVPAESVQQGADQPPLPAGPYMLVPTLGFSAEEVHAVHVLYQMALEQAHAEPRRNFRYEQAHNPGWN